MVDKRHVFFVGLDEFNHQTLRTLPQADEVEFVPAVTFKEMRDDPDVDVSAHLFIRAHEPGIVTHAPSRVSLDRVCQRQGDTRIQVMVNRGTDLSTLANQDSYSFELANVYLGGRDRVDVLDRYDQVLDVLQFEIERERGVI